jgi:RNA polymerase sigma-70 factor, ECF subfamily
VGGPERGVPANPPAWLYATAHRLIIGRLRAEAVAGRKAPLLAVGNTAAVDDRHLEAVGDERLQLILLCCHPALHADARAALALRLVIGTTTEDIAHLFLVSQPTMAARITRAKKKIVAVGIPLSLPVEAELDARLDGVCRTLYLAFTAGYTPRTGPHLVRADLAGEAVELATVLHQLVPDAPQVRALLALMTIQHARRDAREVEGRLVTLADQDRRRWHHDEMQLGVALVDTVPPQGGYAEELRLQALMAREHAVASDATDTNWRSIAVHYEALDELTQSPVVRLNRAVAVAESEGPAAGLALLAGLDEALGAGHRLPAVRAELARRGGDFGLAAASYQLAIERCDNEVERKHLSERLADLLGSGVRG